MKWDQGQSREFDIAALWQAMDTQRKGRGLSWQQVTDEISAASSILVARLGSRNHPLSASTVRNMAKRGSITCQHALGMLRWLGLPPDTFAPHDADRPKAPLPKAGPDRRLRWDIWAKADLLDAERRSRGMTWQQLADELGCSPNQVSGLRHRRYGISIQLAMRIARWLKRPAGDFIVPEEW